MTQTTQFAARQQIKDALLQALDLAISYGQLTGEPVDDFVIEVPADTQNGDFATNIAMKSARAFRVSPRQVAETILQHLVLDGTYFGRAEIAGPGFINFFLDQSYYADVLSEIKEKGADYGRSDFGGGKKVCVEFVSANPTGPMHIGNARGGALGDCLAACMDWAGYNVEREFYVNDAGNQIEKFALSLEARYLQLFDDSIPFPEDGYHGADITVRAKEFYDIYGDRYAKLDEKERREALVAYALPKNIEGLKNDLGTYRIFYDTWFLESRIHQNGELAETIDILKQNGMTYEKDGALWYKATEHGGEKDEVLIRANGHPTYFAADIAYHRNKFLKRGFDLCINVWGADHHGHVARLKGAMDAIGLDGSKLDIVLMQLVRLVRDGELVKVSKRTGKSITLVDLLEEVPVDAARYWFNMREPTSQMEFDLGLAVEETSQNPVYYVQYAHARICSMLKALQEEGLSPNAADKQDLILLTAAEEHQLIRHLGAMTGEIIGATQSYDPARITRFAYETATLFHKFYNACRVKGEEPHLAAARLALCAATKTALANLLYLMKIECPESM